MTVLYFGQIRSVTSLPSEQLTYSGSLDGLRFLLLEKYPALNEIQFIFSVNKMIKIDGAVNDNDEVALLPPFSGG